MLKDKLKEFTLILASNSPRRQYLMREAGFAFQLRVPSEVPEVYPDQLAGLEIPVYLAELKAKSFSGRLAANEILLTADTVVLLDGKVLGKPVDYYEGFDMLSSLSGQKHEVITGVCLMSSDHTKSFYAHSYVWFRQLTEQEIDFYLTEYSPYDKAGAYGIQEWIGYIGVERIEGSFYNVMGLPIQKVYFELDRFIDELVQLRKDHGKQA
jgi:septum formation protein